MSGETNPFEELMRHAKAQGLPIMIIGGPMPGAAAPPPGASGGFPPPTTFPVAPSFPGAPQAPPSFGPPQGFPPMPSFAAPAFPPGPAPGFGPPPGLPTLPGAPPFMAPPPASFPPQTAPAWNGATATPPPPPPGSAPPPPPEGGDVKTRMLVSQNDQLAEEVQTLRTKLAQATEKLQAAESRPAALNGAATHAANPALEQHARALEGRLASAESAATSLARERDALNSKVRELQELIASLRQGGAALAGAPPTGITQPTTLADYNSYPINVLGLEESLVKAIHKAAGAEVKTVGELHAVYRAGKIAAKTEKNPGGRFTKDQCILIGERLLGRVPPAMPEGGVPAAAAPTAQATVPGVPVGVKVRPWPECLESARKKEKKLNGVKADFVRCKGELDRLTAPGQPPAAPETLGSLTKQINELDKIQGLLSGQVLALLFAMGLYEVEWSKEKQAACSTIDGALREAGLVHLMETPAGATK